MGFKGYMNKLDKVRQTNVVKLANNWINDGQQQDLFVKQSQFTQCPEECGQIEHHRHYMSCYTPLMHTENKKCVSKLIKTWGDLRTATPLPEL